MKITIEKLEELGACKSGTDWFRDTHPEGIEHDELVRHLMAERSDWAYWLISKLLTPEQNAVWADYSATIAAAAARYADDAADAARYAAVSAANAAFAAAAAKYAADAAARYAAFAAAAARYAAAASSAAAANYAANAAFAADAARYAAEDSISADCRARIIKKGLDLIMEEQK